MNASFRTYSIPRALGTFPFVSLHVRVHYRARRPPPALPTDRYSTGPLSRGPAYLRTPCNHLLLLSPFARAITDLFRTLFGDEPIAPQTPTHLLAVPPQSGLLFYIVAIGDKRKGRKHNGNMKGDIGLCWHYGVSGPGLFGYLRWKSVTSSFALPNSVASSQEVSSSVP